MLISLETDKYSFILSCPEAIVAVDTCRGLLLKHPLSQHIVADKAHCVSKMCFSLHTCVIRNLNRIPSLDQRKSNNFTEILRNISRMREQILPGRFFPPGNGLGTRLRVRVRPVCPTIASGSRARH